MYRAVLHSNALVSGIVCGGRLCAIKGAQRAAHNWTTRAMSAAPICYVLMPVIKAEMVGLEDQLHAVGNSKLLELIASNAKALSELLLMKASSSI